MGEIDRVNDRDLVWDLGYMRLFFLRVLLVFENIFSLYAKMVFSLKIDICGFVSIQEMVFFSIASTYHV